MLRAKVHTPLNHVIMFWLSRELEKEIPDLDLYGTEKRLLDFASKDLETWLKIKLGAEDSDELEKASNASDNQEEIKTFLKVWTGQWLDKWRERVTLCQKMPTFSLNHVRRKNMAKKIFQQMEKGQELKNWVIQKLINQGEICMPELISVNLIIEHIAYSLKKKKDKASTSETKMKPWQILQDVLTQVNTLAKRKTPLIHMKLIIDN